MRSSTSFEKRGIIDQFFHDVAANPEKAKRDHPKSRTQAGDIGQIVKEICTRAECLAGFHGNKHEWLPWFRRILRSDAGLQKIFSEQICKWPAMERLIFEFYFIESFDLVHIADATACGEKEFLHYLTSIQRRLREAIVREALKTAW